MLRRFISYSGAIICIGVGVGLTVKVVSMIKKKRRSVEIEPNVTASVIIRSEDIGNVIGKSGLTLDYIRLKTGAEVRVSLSGRDGYVTIRGRQNSVEAAINCLKEIIENPEKLQMKNICIPTSYFDREKIRQIAFSSEATITIDWPPATNNERNLVVKGTQKQVAAAVLMFDEMIAANEVLSQRVTDVTSCMLPNMNKLQPTDVPKEVFPSDVFVPVFLSAAENPNSFWVQLVGAKSVALDKLLEDMTQFYSDDKNRSSFQVINPTIGQLVAALLIDDNKWYRARICHIESNDVSASVENLLHVFFVDFGDDAPVAMSDICMLKPEYFALPMQAIQCSLADVAPKEDKWTEDAVSLFQTLSYFAQWKTIMAEPVCTKDANQTESGIIFLKLYDTSTDVDVNISQELVKKGYAKWKK